jgi:hypothetical protein
MDKPDKTNSGVVINAIYQYSISTKYTSVEQQLRKDAAKYTERAKEYLNNNELDKAIGCIEKARRKIKRADMLKLSPLEEIMYGPVLKQYADEVVKRIMEGK